MLKSIVRTLIGRRAGPSAPPVAQAPSAPTPATPSAAADTLADADALYRAGRHAEARALAERIEARTGVTDRTLLLRAHALQYERHFDDAAVLYGQLAPVLERSLGASDRRHVDVLIDWGLALLRAGRTADARPVLDRAAAAAPDYPPAAGCARFPGLMARTIDVPRSALPPRAATAAGAAPPGVIEVVYFFVGRADEPRFDEYMALLGASATVARATQPGARIVVLTDRETPFPDTLGAHVERFDLDRGALMRARFEAVAGHLARKAARGEAVAALYCDPDTLLAGDLAALLDGTFDVACTWRSRFVEERLDHEPFVAGAIYVCAADASVPLRFFRRVLGAFPVVAAWPEVTGFYPQPIDVWRGDQIVPAAVIGWATYREHVLAGRTDRLDIDGVRIGLLPSDPYCWTFDAAAPPATLAAKCVIDFKGERKAHLAGVAARLLAAPDDADQRRDAAAAALLAGDVQTAAAQAQAWLTAAGDGAARATVRRLANVHPPGTISAGIEVIAQCADPAVASTADLSAGATPHAAWSAPFKPTPAAVLRIARGAAVAPGLVVTADDALIDDADGYPPSERVHHAATSATFLAAAAGAIVLAERWTTRVAIDTRVFYLGASANHAEWLLGDVPRLMLADAAQDLPVALHGDVRASHLATLALLGVPAERVHAYPAAARLEFTQPVTFATTTLRHHAPCATAVRRLRQRLPAAALAGGPRKVYLSRAGIPGSRLIRNEADVEALLADRGFAIVRPETLGMVEQAHAVASAEIIVGPYGANLANLLFAPPGSRAVIIATKPQPEFARLLAIVGIPFRHLVPAAVQVRQGRTYSESVEFDVDLAELRQSLDA